MMRRKPTWAKLSRLFSAVLLISFSAACSGIQLRAGNRPNVDLLEKPLRLGESTRADVLTALGEPIGKGRAFLPIDPKLKTATMWSYYYEEGTFEDDRRIFLFVFFDEDRYDGYMWFSSLPKQSARASGDVVD
jgi:hypothetical protein